MQLNSVTIQHVITLNGCLYFPHLYTVNSNGIVLRHLLTCACVPVSRRPITGMVPALQSAADSSLFADGPGMGRQVWSGTPV